MASKNFIIELAVLKGRDKLSWPIFALLELQPATHDSRIGNDWSDECRAAEF